MDLSIFAHPSFLVFLATQVGAGLCLVGLAEWLHTRALRRGAQPLPVYRSRRACRVAIAGLFLLGLGIFLGPAYQPLLGESKLRSGYAALERSHSTEARRFFGEAVEHLEAVADATEVPGFWAGLVERFVQPWGGRSAVLAALGSAHFLLGACVKARPYLERELSSRPLPTRAALLSYRLAVCAAHERRRDDAEEALLQALLIDRTYARQAKGDPRLRRIAESLLAKRL